MLTSGVLADKSSNTDTTRQTPSPESTVYIAGALKTALQLLIDKHSGTGRPVEDGQPTLENLCGVLERLLNHGLIDRPSTKTKWQSMLKTQRTVWDFIQATARSTRAESACRLVANVSQLDGIKTAAGRLRAWLRVSLMEQRLADQWSLFMEEKNQENLSSFYEPWSLMRKQRHEVSIAEMLMGLNSLEFNLCLRGADLDNNPASDRIEWSVLFAQHQQPLGATSVDRMKGGISSSPDNNDNNNNSRQLQLAVEQKSFLESMNRELKIRLGEAEEQLKSTRQAEQTLQDQNLQLTIQLEASRRLSATLQQRVDQLTAELQQQQQQQQQQDDTQTSTTETLKSALPPLSTKESRQTTTTAASPSVDELTAEMDRLKIKMERESNILKATQERLVSAIRAKESMRRDLELASKRIVQLTGGAANNNSGNTGTEQQQQQHFHAVTVEDQLTVAVKEE